LFYQPVTYNIRSAAN